MNAQIEEAARILKKGGIIAYPTEGLYGLGCDPFNEAAVLKLLALKKRSLAQGLILIAADMSQVLPCIQPLDAKILKKLEDSWPGANTWLIPKSDIIPTWICGDHDKVAIRVSAHPLARALCQAFGQVIVSSSANRHQEPALINFKEVAQAFPQLDFIVEGEVLMPGKASTIRNALNDAVIRQ